MSRTAAYINLTRPDGIITGFTLDEPSPGCGMLQLLTSIAPHINHAAVILNPDHARTAIVHAWFIEK